MRHRRLRRKLGVKTNHRKALLRNLIRSLVIHKRIETTYAKAKEASSFADRMVEIAKAGDLHARRLLISKLGMADTAHALITEIAPQFKDRAGGYTRVLRLGTRVGDGGQVALLEFTATFELPEKAKKAKKAKKEKEKEAKAAPEPEKEKPKKEKPAPKEAEKPSAEKKESEKKGGFLSALRRFLKGDEEGH